MEGDDNERQNSGTIMTMTTFLILLTILIDVAKGFSAKPWKSKDISGIWRLTTTPTEEQRILRIQNDGTFQECKDDDRGSSRGLLKGLWDYKESSNTFMMALDSKENAVLLEGTLEAHETEVMEDASLLNHDEIEKQVHVQVNLAVEGQVFTGTRLYPKSHPSYFELYQPTKRGTFSLRQVLGRLFVRTREETVEPRYKQNDFYGKHFWLAVMPLPAKNRGQNQQQQQDKSVSDVIREEAVDIRLMPIQFFANNTFCATGNNKVLRGRFGVNEKDQLWFQVSLFGAGRSVSGSVYR
jgi:hypothetical protein